MIKVIEYDVKSTSANTTYVRISNEDMVWILDKLTQIQNYFGELTLCKDKDVKELVNWYTKSNKRWPYSYAWKKHNSPQSFVAGTINNLMYNNTQDISEITMNTLEQIISMYENMTQAVEEVTKIKLQKSVKAEGVMFRMKLVEIK